MTLEETLRKVELFHGLYPDELHELASLFKEIQLQPGDLLAEQGAAGDALFIVSSGFVQVTIVNDQRQDVLVNLGKGQIIGEMALVDKGPRSATVVALSRPTIVHEIHRRDFESLCDRNTRIGYIVMRNIAADLSFKLRQRNLAG